eukprot:SAG31_NODE_1359_length_8639_cov_3.889813_5_plen_56_part_00
MECAEDDLSSLAEAAFERFLRDAVAATRPEMLPADDDDCIETMSAEQAAAGSDAQ